MHDSRDSLKTTIYFLLDNQQSATIVEYIATKYGLSLNPQKTLAQNAQSLVDHLMQYTRVIVAEFQPLLNLAAYMGKWYSAASIPQPFDKGTAWKTAVYELLPAMVKVTNTAYNQDDSVRAVIVGTARVADAQNPAALYVSFPTGQPQTGNPQANYLIHRTDYASYAVVGSYDGSNLYFLVRQRPISAPFYNQLLDYAAGLGYDTTKVVQDYGAVQYSLS